MTAVRVLLDAHMLGQRETGNETYVRGLLSGLALRDDIDVAAAVHPDYQVDASDAARVTWLRLPTRNNWRRLARDLARLSRSWGAEVVHATYIAPYGTACPVVVSVHDVSFLRYPQYFSRRDRLLFSILLPASLRRAAAVLTLSSHGRDELREFYPSLRTPVHVVPAAPSDVFRPIDASATEETLARHGVRRPFFLAVGSLQPRKNLLRLVEAFQALRIAHPDLQLAIVGPGGYRSSSVHDRVEKLGLTTSVRLLGYLSECDLCALYNAAVALVYPSVYEGFGLPVVEAMACGRPVIAANTSSLPEVAHDAAVLIDPFDVSALHAAMERLANDARLARDLGGRGLARAATFSWRQSASAAVTAYRAACQTARS
jgi:glycosyltransferase involved in cell wall biosynthesis